MFTAYLSSTGAVFSRNLAKILAIFPKLLFMLSRDAKSRLVRLGGSSMLGELLEAPCILPDIDKKFTKLFHSTLAFASLVAPKRDAFVHINWFNIAFLEKLNVTRQGISIPPQSCSQCRRWPLTSTEINPPRVRKCHVIRVVNCRWIYTFPLL